jgi:hypothetical protein
MSQTINDCYICGSGGSVIPFVCKDCNDFANATKNMFVLGAINAISGYNYHVEAYNNCFVGIADEILTKIKGEGNNYIKALFRDVSFHKRAIVNHIICKNGFFEPAKTEIMVFKLISTMLENTEMSRSEIKKLVNIKDRYFTKFNQINKRNGYGIMYSKQDIEHILRLSRY